MTMTDQPAPAPRTCGCGAPLPDTPLVRAALALWDEVDHYGNLHCEVDDGNLEDYWFEPDPDHPRHRTARQYVEANEAGAGPAAQAVELRLVGILEEMTYGERCAAYGTCEPCMDEAHRRCFGRGGKDGDGDGWPGVATRDFAAELGGLVTTWIGDDGSVSRSFDANRLIDWAVDAGREIGRLRARVAEIEGAGKPESDPDPEAAEPRTFDLRGVASIVETEGLGYAIECYMGESAVEDPALREQWRRARVAMGRIRAMLPEIDGEDDEE